MSLFPQPEPQPSPTPTAPPPGHGLLQDQVADVTAAAAASPPPDVPPVSPPDQMPPPAGALPLALPAQGRIYTGHHRVRLGDAAPSRRMRLDALARFLQDVAEDDAADAAWPDDIGWVLRSTRLTIRRFPTLGETLRLDTFCSASAARWAERTTTVTGEAGGLVQATSVWVAIDVATGSPARLGEPFSRVYGPSTSGRRVSARLQLPAPTAEAVAAARPWPLRRADLDVWGHVNNAISWAAVEDELCRVDWLPATATLEHHQAIGPDDQPRLAASRRGRGLDVWLVDPSGRMLSAAHLEPQQAGPPG